jgi:hypothetical protein
VTFSYSYEILFVRASFEPTRQQLSHSRILRVQTIGSRNDHDTYSYLR